MSQRFVQFTTSEHPTVRVSLDVRRIISIGEYSANMTGISYEGPKGDPWTYTVIEPFDLVQERVNFALSQL